MCTFLHLLHLLNRFPAVHQSPQSRIFCIIFVSCPFFVQIKRCRSHKCFSSKGMWHILFSFTKNVLNFTKNPSYYLQILSNFYCIFNFFLIQFKVRNSIKTTKKVEYGSSGSYAYSSQRLTFTNKLIALISQYVLRFSHFSISLQYINCICN